MKFTLEIDSRDAAMVEDGAGEVCRLLRDVARKIESGLHDGYSILRDVNGNKAGEWRIDDELGGDDA